MSDPSREHRDAVVDAYTRLTADVTAPGTSAAASRLQRVTASALRAQLRAGPAIEASAPLPTRLHAAVPESARTATLEALEALEAGGEPDDVLVVARRDAREMLLSGRLVDGLTGLAPGERIGPFPTYGGIDVWFDVFFAARRIQVRQAGVSTPAIVLTQARRPVVTGSTTVIDVAGGTVWLRGDLVGGLPTDAFVGVRVRGGSLRLDTGATVTGDVVEVAAALDGELRWEPEPDVVTPAAGGCASAGASATLPESVTFTFQSGTFTVESGSGAAAAWGQAFELRQPTGGFTFIERLWTVVLGYEIRPDRFDAGPIADDLVRLAGVGEVSGGGLGLPVVVVPDPAMLGEAAHSAHWLLLVTGLTARWYEPDPRAHQLTSAWVAISDFGATIVADGIAPLAPAVTHGYDLWTIAGGDQRLPWRQTYDTQFWLWYRCHLVDGEQLMVPGRADLALDRPVTTDGAPVATPTTQGMVLLHRFDGTITATLGASFGADVGADVEAEPAMHQFALRNALVWTSAPRFCYVRGALLPSGRIDAGQAQLAFGGYAWVPTLPDPYVSNGFIRRPRASQERPRTILMCRVAWDPPEAVTVSFEGQLGPNLALGGRPASPGEPGPAPGSEHVGPTQVEQGRLGLDRRSEVGWQAAQAREAEDRGKRQELAQRENSKSLEMVDGYLAEVLGPAPNLLLLDVSTNQDLLGVAVGRRSIHRRQLTGNLAAGLTADIASGAGGAAGPVGDFPVSGLAVHAQVANLRVVALPQVQWEPVRTLDTDQDIMTMGWFPTPLASAGDGGASQIGARSQRLAPVIPADVLDGTVDAFRDGTPVGVRTTFPFGLIAAIAVQPADAPHRPADQYGLTRPEFPEADSVGGIQVTAHAEGGREDNGGQSAAFAGRMRQLLNGVDLASGAPLGLSVLGETLQPAGSVETVFNNDLAANPRVPVARIDLSGYGGSNFSDWNNPFAAFAEAAKVQFRVVVGRTALEVIKVNSVLHPWGVRVTRSVTIERRPGGGVIRRDSGWQAFTPGLFDYRYLDAGTGQVEIAPYRFDAGVFRGLFHVRTIRPAPGTVFGHGSAELVPYYFDADVALDGAPGRSSAAGILGWLQVAPNGVPAGADALRALIAAQGPVGGPIDTWLDVGGSGLPLRAQRVEVGLADDGGTPLFVATVRGMPKLPETGAWSVVTRPVANVPAGGGEALPVAESRGTPLIRRYPVAYPASDTEVFSEPPLSGSPGAYRFADAADLLAATSPANDYALVQSTPTHAFLFPRPSVQAGVRRVESGHQPALADILARSTSKGAFPPPGNTIELAPGAVHLDVGPTGKLALSAPVEVVNHPTPLRLAGTDGHGSQLFYDQATLRLELAEDRWAAELSGLRIWTDIAGLERLAGSELRIVGATDQRPQIAEIRSLLLAEIDEILQYIPFFGDRGVDGPIDLGASNAKHELKFDAKSKVTFPKGTIPLPADVNFTLTLGASSGLDLVTGGATASAVFGAELEGRFPVLTVGVAKVFIIVSLKVTFTIKSLSGSVKSETFELVAFAGIGVEGKIGPFKAYAFLGVGFVLSYEAVEDVTKYGGLVALEAGVDLQVVKVKIRAELKGLVYDEAGVTKADYQGSVKIQVDLFLIISISASYQVTDTATL